LSKPNLSQFIIQENGNEEGEGWDEEVWESNHSGTKTNIEPWNVAEESNKSSFLEKTEVTHKVAHTLLRK